MFGNVWELSANSHGIAQVLLRPLIQISRQHNPEYRAIYRSIVVISRRICVSPRPLFKLLRLFLLRIGNEHRESKHNG